MREIKNTYSPLTEEQLIGILDSYSKITDEQLAKLEQWCDKLANREADEFKMDDGYYWALACLEMISDVRVLVAEVQRLRAALQEIADREPSSTPMSSYKQMAYIARETLKDGE